MRGLHNLFGNLVQRALFTVPAKISSDHQIISHDDLHKLRGEFSSVWKNNQLPQKQWSVVEKQLSNPDTVPHFKAAVDMAKKTRLKNPSVLEIGCSSGYLSEVFSKAGLTVNYEGCDYSPAFIKLAKRKYPQIKFRVADTTKLPYKKDQFDIVISGGCLQHVVDYGKAITETARVAKRFVIFHRTPVLHISPTIFFTKQGYGEKMLEIFLNEEEFYDIFSASGLQAIMVRTLTQHKIQNLPETMFVKNYLCRKI